MPPEVDFSVPDELQQAFSSWTDAGPGAASPFPALWARAADPAARWLCAAGQLMSVAVDYADFRGLAEWIERFAEGCRLQPPIAGAADRLRIAAAWITWPSLDHRASYDDPATRAAAQRLLEALLADPPVGANERMLLCKLLVDYHSQQHEVKTILRIAAFAQEHLRRDDVLPGWRGAWWLQMTLNHEYFGDAVAARDAFERAMALAERDDQRALRFELLCIEMNAAMKQDDLARGERIFAELDRLRPDVRAGRVPQGLRAQAGWLARKGELGAALERVELLLAICADVQVPAREQGAYQVLRAYCLTGLRRHDEALAVLAALRGEQNGSQGELLQVIERLTEAARALDAGDAATARARVAAGLRDAARLKWNRFMLPLPALAARIADIALADGIETEFVVQAVRERRLVPPDTSCEDWPWWLRIHAFGELRILRDGEPVRAGGAKAPRKPLELLGALAAHGGDPVDVESLIDTLWPSLDANAPKASFEMAVSRLRKLLAVPDAVLVADGTVSLNKAIVWCDVCAFEQLEARAMQARRAGRDADALVERALALYRDRLLGTEEVGGRLAALRERLAVKFTRLAIDHGERLEARGDWRAAVALYERALTLDMLCEPLYRALMRAHQRRGEQAEALRSFRRCREVLAATLGSAPGPETLALLRELSDADG